MTAMTNKRKQTEAMRNAIMEYIDQLKVWQRRGGEREADAIGKAIQSLESSHELIWDMLVRCDFTSLDIAYTEADA